MSPISVSSVSPVSPVLLAIVAVLASEVTGCAQQVPTGFTPSTDDDVVSDAAASSRHPTPIAEASVAIDDASTPAVPSFVVADAAAAAVYYTGTLDEASAAPGDRDAASGGLQDGAGPAETPTPVDAATPVDASTPANASMLVDASTPAAPLTEEAAAPPSAPPAPFRGDVLITEVMFDPLGPKPEAEWFEVYNATDRPVSLSGLTIQDGYLDTHVIAADPPVMLAPNAYGVLVRDGITAFLVGIPTPSVIYEYGTGLPDDQGIEFENGPRGGVSLWNDGVELASVPYGPWDAGSIGQTIELDGLVFDGSDRADRWCLGQNPWTEYSDWGTPGAASDCP
jgi:hypothetical protein